MKTTLFLKSVTTFVILIMAVNLCFAETHDPKVINALKQTMTKQVPYPEFAIESLESGFAVIAFDVEQDGKIVLKAINASTPEFKDYVEEKLKDIVLEDPQNFTSETQYFRFDFKLVDEL